MNESVGFKSVLVPLDGSELAEQALPVGASLAGKAGVPLHLVSVQEPLTSMPYAMEFPAAALEIQDELHGRLSEYLTRVTSTAQADGAPVVRTAVLDGMVAPQLTEYIVTESIDLVVMTTHGRGGLNRLWLGSVADRLLRTAGVPMLLLRPRDPPAALSCRRILVALDGEIEQEVLESVRGLLELMPEASVVLTRIVEPPVPGLTRLAVRPARFGSDWTERHEIEARNYLARLAERLRPLGRSIETQVLVGHPIADRILGMAHAIGADLVVLGTHGSRGVERLLLGSVADKVIRMSDLPLLIAPVRRHRKRGETMMQRFRDRQDAGQQLAAQLERFADSPNLIVLGLPRGGVPVAAEVARALHARLDVFVVRKLGVPGHEELAMGAIATGGVRVLHPEVVRQLRIPDQTIEAVAAAEARELDRREREYRRGRPFPEVRDATVILVDDGVATGSTMLAAVEALRRLHPGRVVVAAPVMSRGALASLTRVADDCECLSVPEPFVGVGMWYRDFAQTTDDQVRALLGSVAPPAETPYANRS